MCIYLSPRNSCILYDNFYCIFYESLVPVSSNQKSEYIEILKKNALNKTYIIFVALRLYHHVFLTIFFTKV